jgi:plasmid maintenance system killer protein
LRDRPFYLVESRPEDMNPPGLRGTPQRWAVAVTGNWRITWSWNDGATDIDLEDYH